MMSKRWLCCLLAAAACMAPSACRQAEGPAAAKPAAVQELHWVMAVQGAPPPAELENYEIFAPLLRRYDLKIRLNVWEGNLDSHISKALVSGALPAAMTFYMEDTAAYKLEGMNAATDILTLDEGLFESIPQGLRDLHTRFDKLWYVPGGYGAGEPSSWEGVFVRQYWIDRGMISRSPTADEWIRDLEQICAVFRTENGRSTDRGAVALDCGQFGWGVLAHLFGLQEPTAQEVQAHTARLDMVRFFSQLGEANVVKDNFLKIQSNESAEWEDSTHLFIGRKRLVEQYNATHPDNPFIQIYPQLDRDGFLLTCSPTGYYKTYLFAENLPAKGLELICYLQSEDGSLLAMLGREDVNWAKDGSTPIPFASTVKMMEDPSFRRSSGIAQFPFLSRVGAVYPTDAPAGESVPLRVSSLQSLPYDERILENERLRAWQAILTEAFIQGGRNGYATGERKLKEWETPSP